VPEHHGRGRGHEGCHGEGEAFTKDGITPERCQELLQAYRKYKKNNK